MKINPVGAELFHAEEQIDMTQLMATSPNSANAPKRWWKFSSGLAQTKGEFT